MPKMFAHWTRVSIASAALMAATPALAQETTTYTYDARGRLVTTTHVGGRNDAVVVTAQFDPADNRTQYTITGKSKRPVVVVPLNGYTVIPLP